VAIDKNVNKNSSQFAFDLLVHFLKNKNIGTNAENAANSATSFIFV
jgi:hypothetical protein